jgi:TM2 domain-containing membrane protein YozV
MSDDKLFYFMATNGKYFPGDKLVYIQDQLRTLNDSKLIFIGSLEFHDPTIMLLVSVFLGTWGVDRFLMGDIGMGFFKLFTGGLCGIVTVIDWFSVMDRAREKNFLKLMTVLTYAPR